MPATTKQKTRAERLAELYAIYGKPSAREAALAEKARRNLSAFAMQAWHVLEPSTPYVHGWHIEAISEHLMAVTDGQIKNLLINIPPRHMKSLLATVAWFAWSWIEKPHLRWMFSSYALQLSIRDSRKCRQVIESPWYQRNFGDSFTLAPDQNAKARFENDHRGYRLAVSTDSSATGEGGDLVICDDPHNAREIGSTVKRQTVLDWWDQTMSTRLNNPKTGARVVIMQRLDAKDLAGHLLERGDHVHLCLPAEFEPSRKCFTSIGWSDPRKEEGELLWPQRMGHEEIAKAKRTLGPLGYAGQYQQRPAPAGGAIFQKKWLRRYSLTNNGYITLHAPDGDKHWPIKDCRCIGTVDVATSKKETADYTVVATWLITPDGELVLRDLARRRMSSPEQQEAIKAAHSQWRYESIHIESVAYQLALVQQLLPMGIPAMPFYPAGGDKVSRATTASIFYAAGMVYHPLAAEWLGEFEEELLLFPKAEHDDQCLLPSTNLPYLSHDDKINYSFYHHEGEKNMRIGKAQDLKVGDLVLTHTGKWQKIIRVIERHQSGEVVAIKPQGSFEIVLTPEHPVYCVKRTGNGEFYKPRAVGEPQWIPAGEIVPGDSVLEAIDQTITPIKRIDLTEWLLAQRNDAQGKRSQAGLYLSKLIIEPDVIRFNNPRSHPIKRIVPVSNDLCRLLGYYVAEGSRGKHNVSWSFNALETDYLNDTRSLLESLFGTSPSAYTASSTTTLSVSSLVLHDFFAQFGQGAKNKTVPAWIMHLPTELQIEFLKGAWRGDGCIDQDGNFVYATSSHSLVIALRMILYRLKIVPAISISRKNGASGHSINGKIVKQSTALYILKVGGNYASQFAQLLGLPDTRMHIENGRIADRIVDGYVHRRVRKVEFQDYDGLVYNFEVEHDHSYQTESFVVHNCDVVSMACALLFDGGDIPMASSTGGPAVGETPLAYYTSEDEEENTRLQEQQNRVAGVLGALRTGHVGWGIPQGGQPR